jgi:glycyl-radical enzyme activating protein family
MNGTIFDIKGFSIHDGDGARTTVFLKGCPLRCAWCHNPEGLSFAPQLMKRKASCANCGACVKGCSHDECQKWGVCLYACPENLVTVCGYEISATDLAAKLLKNKDFLNSNGGGVTFSGGEPLSQSDFILSVIPLLEGMHTAVETSGYVPEADFIKAASAVDTVMIDVKLADSARHEKYTGVKNDLILRNLSWLQNSGVRHVIRVPLIPGITDTYANLLAVAEIAGESAVELLPYNNLAGSKYDSAGVEFILPREIASLRESESERVAYGDIARMFTNARVM